MHLAHSMIKPVHWCRKCECALNADEADVIPLTLEQGCEGATTLYLYECGACGQELDDYQWQDDNEVYSDD